MPGISITIMDEINIGQRSSGQVCEGKSMCLRIFRREGQIEDLKMYSSYQDAVGLDGEPIELERKSCKDFRLLVFFARNRTIWRQKNIKPEDFKDRIIFMSMSNDIVWKMKNLFRNQIKWFTRWSSCIDIGVINSAWEKKQDESLFLWSIKLKNMVEP